MNAHLHNTFTDLSGTQAAIAKPAAKSAKKARDNSMQTLVMVKAHEFYASERKRLTKRLPNRTMSVPAFSMSDFGRHLRAAWRYVKALKAKAAWESSAAPKAVMDEATFQSCRTDGVVRAA